MAADVESQTRIRNGQASFGAVDKLALSILDWLRIPIRPTDQSLESGPPQTQSTNLSEVVVVPGRRRGDRHRHQRSQIVMTDPPVKEKQFPFFTVSISIIQWIFFKHLYFDKVILFCVFDPFKRYEIWRYVTYMLVHRDPMHFWGNLILQLIVGCPFEVVYQSKLLVAVYMVGVIFSPLMCTVVKPWAYLAGASGGIYAILGAHFAAIVVDWNKMRRASFRCFLLLAYVALQVRLTFSDLLADYIGDLALGVLAAHAGGALAGFLVGLNGLAKREGTLQIICRYATLGFLAVTVTVGIIIQAVYTATDVMLFNANENFTAISLEYYLYE